MEPVNRFLCYLNHYQNQDLEAVSAMFADDVQLRDWKISVVGKAAAISETEKNFANVDGITIEVLSTMVNANAVAGELIIVVDGSEVLHVVDVIRFNEAGLVTSIHAYLGRSN
ncbi:nuclear transport factor 2 family protein [Ferrimonas senticii]|uniref:nuclear transport factor 2 family protein n=1 Tax=Ferrimonas senticii TaxID=394566 RepID=UPI000417E83F|nr:nuclear transport factor 2 family protein [Ferrimonas senticii]